jgi:hypothetical protein
MLDRFEDPLDAVQERNQPSNSEQNSPNTTVFHFLPHDLKHLLIPLKKHWINSDKGSWQLHCIRGELFILKRYPISSTPDNRIFTQPTHELHSLKMVAS